MKATLLIAVLFTWLAATGARAQVQGTQQRAIITTTHLFRNLATNETVAELNSALGITPLAISLSADTPGPTNSTAYYFPVQVSLPVGIYSVNGLLQTAATNTEVGLSSTNLSSLTLVGSNQGTNPVIIWGTLTVTDPVASYGLYVRQISTSPYPPIISSNSVAYFTKLK